MSEPADAAARHRILTEFGSTFFVEAAAGTGKTTALVGRIIGLIRSGTTTLARIVAVTFTEKAAGEMKLRLRTEIERARATAREVEKDRLDQALEELELARMGTIHAFCGDLLRERPVEAGIDPLFAVTADDEARALADQAFDAWFQRVLADPPEGVRRLLRRRGGEPPREQLRGAMHTLRDHRDFPHPWRRDPFDRDRIIDALMKEFVELGALGSKADRSNDTLAQDLRGLKRFLDEAVRLEKSGGRDYDGLETALKGLARQGIWKRKGAAKTKFGPRTRDEVLARRDDAKTARFVPVGERGRPGEPAPRRAQTCGRRLRGAKGKGPASSTF